ncbi:MAG TPA: Asp-tRNA(Asn)/Glu-tRNA(Gln) amidotransferase subunit GatC [Phycisphaerae bacterium]|nr:Asp-tRNA(Asn)/Glu-tRNA(Gln) amidotransferase subunit GatC [Phycisphaerae bacterium]
MSQRIDDEQVRHIAHLARLKLSDEEIARLGGQLRDILSYVEKLNEVDTAGVEPTAHPLPVRNVFREDVITPSLGVERVLANAPAAAGPYFKVPKVLDQIDA